MVAQLIGQETVGRSVMSGDLASKPMEVTKHLPCPHCGKPDWCYSIGELTVCNRDAQPARGWEQTSKTDRNGKPYYAPEKHQKPPRPQGKKEYIYYDRDGQPLVKVTRIDDGNGKKRIFQSHWDSHNWVKGLTDEAKASIPIYRYSEIKAAIADGRTIFIVEGEGIADILWEMGIPATTTIGGALKYRAYGNYQADLEDANLVLCPDRDEPGLKHMEDIFKDFPDAKWLYAPPNDFYWTHLAKNGGLDIKDWVEDGATAEDILQAIEDRRIVVDALNKSLEADAERSRTTESKLEQKFNQIRAVWGERLRWNTLKKQVELDGQPLPLDRIDLKIARQIHIDISKEQGKGIVLDLAQENPYSPVVEYLERVSHKHTDVDISILDTIASRYFGTNDPLHAALMKRTLIAAVARAYEPGCKHDEITILQGKQKSLKSTFWRVLAGKQFFTDDISGTEKDEIMKIGQYWLLEYAEFENSYKKKDVSQLKAFLSRLTDSIRRPYGTDIEDLPRPSIFVGTTNQDEFLYDPTGERRFWVVSVLVNRINIQLLQKERDLIWAAAVTAYKSGEQWHLTDTEDEWLEAANKHYQSTDPWEAEIMAWANIRNEVSASEILSEVLKIELAKQGMAEKNRVTQILRANGWNRGSRKRIAGKLLYPWTKPQLETRTESGTPLEQQLEQSETIAPQELEIECSSCSSDSPKFLENFDSSGGENFTPPPEKDKSLKSDWNTTEPENTETVIQQASDSCSSLCSTTSVDRVIANAELIRESIVDESWQMIDELIEEWTDEFKSAVWGLLTPVERKAVKQLKPKA
ncbi:MULTISPECIES: VapE domain-containing protein [unclassified Nostoc]|uniref:VapE domain-containing protein n=1 Tax=unclassified Nostoc TaxID=2593658 RepID=UPI0021AB6869|nr:MULTISPECIES: VapE domain-containing protein [unclassified Nostoc]